MQDSTNRKMSRRTFLGTSAAVAAMLGLAACGGANVSDSHDDGKKRRIAVLCDDAGKNDNGYNQAAVEGAGKVCDEKGWEFKVVEPTNGVPDALESLGEEGYDVVFNMAYDFEALINGVGGAEPLAAQYPSTEWVIFNDNPNKSEDGSVKHKNVIAVLYDLNESSFLAGALSVLVNESASVLFEGAITASPTPTLPVPAVLLVARTPLGLRCSPGATSRASTTRHRSWASRTTTTPSTMPASPILPVARPSQAPITAMAQTSSSVLLAAWEMASRPRRRRLASSQSRSTATRTTNSLATCSPPC